jgi:hypothetical protein
MNTVERKRRTRKREIVRKRALSSAYVSTMSFFNDLKDGSNREAPITIGVPRLNIDADKSITVSAAPKPLAQ